MAVGPDVAYVLVPDTLAAFSIVYSTPVVLLYVLISRRLGGGFALGGAVKG